VGILFVTRRRGDQKCDACLDSTGQEFGRDFDLVNDGIISKLTEKVSERGTRGSTAAADVYYYFSLCQIQTFSKS
jgi:hypothetical protein